MEAATPTERDPGIQSIWTGVVGASFVLGLYWGYALYRLYTLPGGGPVVPTLFSYLPEWFRFQRVNRDYFDILCILVLGFVLMAAWERSAGRFARPARATLLLAGAGGVWGVWHAPATVMEWDGRAVTGVELRFLAAALAIAGIALFWAGARRGAARGAAEAAAPGRPPVPWGRAVRSGFVRWASLLALFTLAVLIYNGHRYYVGFPRGSNGYFENWRMTVTILWSAFAVVGLPYAVWSVRVRRKPGADAVDPGLILFLVYRTLWRGLRTDGRDGMRRLGNRRVRSALLDLLVKAFFLPLMVSFLYIEAGGFNNNLRSLVDYSGGEGIGKAGDILSRIGHALTGGYDPGGGNRYLFPTLVHWLRSGIFVMDVSLGTLGYACSFWWLGNKSKSVDPTVSGWAVALMCYPPFNMVSDLYFPYIHGTGQTWEVFQTPWLQSALLVVAIVCFAVYVWATMAFGIRFSNLTHRGIISCGPYAFLRHPAYISKNLAWWAESLPTFGSWTQAAFLLGWNLIYFARAITEERHLLRDPDYQAYCRRVRRRFIPGVW